MNILVTGGLGFIGSNLISELSKNKDNIIYSLDNNFTSENKNKVFSKNIEYIFGDTREIDRIFADINIDLVYHLGEYSRIVSSFEDIEIVKEFNANGTFRVVKFCADKNIKLIYAASSSKFGDAENQHLSPYAWFKAKNVELIKNFSRWFGLRYSIAYFFNVYGDNQIYEGKYSAVIGRFMQQYLNGEDLTVVYPGDQKRDFTHVSDIVRGLIKLIECGDNEEFQFGTGDNYTILELAKAFDHPYIIIPERRGERFEGKAMKDESTRKIEWEAEIDVIDYIKRFVNINNTEI